MKAHSTWSWLMSCVILLGMLVAGAYEFGLVQHEWPESALAYSGYQALWGIVVLSLGGLQDSVRQMRGSARTESSAVTAGQWMIVVGTVLLLSAAGGALYLLVADY